MQGCILQPDPTAQAQAIESHIAPSPTLTPQQRLAIYQRGYLARLRECMAGQFKALRHALGENLFGDFVEEYLRVYASRSPTLSELGDRFTRYLEETRPDAAEPPERREPWADFMIDLARYEWDIFQKFDAVGHEGKPFADDATADDRLRLQPSLSLHCYDFPVDAYYHGVSSGTDPEIPYRGVTRIAILRKDFRIGMFRLTGPQHDCLAKIQQGFDVSTALAETAREQNVRPEEAAAAWARWRPHWIAQGFFIPRDRARWGLSHHRGPAGVPCRARPDRGRAARSYSRASSSAS